MVDYADPELYGWGSVIVGILALLVGVLASVVSTHCAPGLTPFLLVLGGVLLIAGLLIVRKGE
jgi:hypothetical protein